MINPRSTHVHNRRMPKIMKPETLYGSPPACRFTCCLDGITELSLQKENMIFIKKVAQFIQVPEKMRQLCRQGNESRVLGFGN